VFLDMLISVAQTALMTLERYRPLLLRASALLSPLVLALGLAHFGLPGAAGSMGIARALPPLEAQRAIVGLS
jgi:hypothetical protein